MFIKEEYGKGERLIKCLLNSATKEEKDKYISSDNGVILVDFFKWFCDENSDFFSDIKTEPDYKKQQMLYLLKCQNYYKIGITKNIKKRVRAINKSIPFKVEIIGSVYLGSESATAEQYWHKYYKKWRVQGEWFDMPQEEVFALTMFMQSNGGSVYIDKIMDVGKNYKDYDTVEKIISKYEYPDKETRHMMSKRLNRINTGLIELEMDYHERKERLEKYHEKEKLLLSCIS